MKEYLKLSGRIVGIKKEAQSFCIESKKALMNRLWVYTDDALFKRLNRILTAAQFDGEKGKEIVGTFYIQGRVLMGFTAAGSKTWDDLLRSAEAWVNQVKDKEPEA